MKDYQIGKDIGYLLARVDVLERNAARIDAATVMRAAPLCGGGISDDVVLESLRLAAPDEKSYEILARLVIDAGHITIRDLFALSGNDVSPAALAALTQAKEIGFLGLSNDKCCHEVDDPFSDDVCRTKAGKWCSLVRAQTKWRCTLASDKC